MADVLWEPAPERAAASAMEAFRKGVERKFGVVVADYAALHRWSVENRDEFWGEVWDFCEVVGEKGETVLEDGDRMLGSRWFSDARLSFAENLLCRADDSPAVIFQTEGGDRRELSFAELRAEVARCQAGLRACGVGEGDVVAGWLPNLPESLVGMLAANGLGAAWTSCSPDFGASGVLDRFGQVQPKVLLAVDGYRFKGKDLELGGKLAEIRAGLPDLTATVLIPFLRSGATLEGTVAWDDFLGEGHEPEFLPLPFDHPLYILYSSGTTGKPKCIVHGQGGVLLQHLKEHRFHCDLRADERLFYFTTTGWMMWNWLATGLASGATLMLYEGNPFHPGPEALWDFVQREGVNLLGTSAKYLDACAKAGLRPFETHDLSPVRTILSTGSPLMPESFDWVHEAVKPDVQLASICGGTDLVSCFILGNPLLPVRRGEVQCLGLGMAVEVWDSTGSPLVGEPGELVCTRSFPSMPIGFWGDEDGSLYRAAYFERYPGVWHHGDWVELRPEGGMVVRGRSDTTLNPGGVRIGTAEIYCQVERVEEVEEAVVVGRDTGDGDQEVALFVRLRDGVELDDTLRARIRDEVRTHASPRHVPAVIEEVADIPRTRSGKISEIAVRDVLHGRPVQNTEALQNPDALALYLPFALPGG